jgi:hypothetical protein
MAGWWKTRILRDAIGRDPDRAISPHRIQTEKLSAEARSEVMELPVDSGMDGPAPLPRGAREAGNGPREQADEHER